MSKCRRWVPIVNDNLAMTVNTKFYDIKKNIVALFIDMYVFLLLISISI